MSAAKAQWEPSRRDSRDEVSTATSEATDNSSSSCTTAGESESRWSSLPAFEQALGDQVVLQKTIGAALERSKLTLERQTGGVAASGVLEPLVNADVGLAVGGREGELGNDS